MALGAITTPTGIQANTTWGNKKVRTRHVVLTSGANYAEGGETISPSAVGLSKYIEQVIGGSVARATAAGATARTVGFNYITSGATAGSVKMQVYTTGSAEAAADSNQSAFTARLTFIGV